MMTKGTQKTDNTTEPIPGTAIFEKKNQLQPVEWEIVAYRLIMHSSCWLT